MHICAQTHGRTYVQPHTPTHIYIYTPMYTHVRTYTRTRRKFSDNESVLQHYQTEFNHQSDSTHFYYPITVQSISILAPHWLRHLYKLSAFCHSSVTYLHHSSIYLSTIHLFNHLYSHLTFIITTTHHLAHIIFHLYLMSIPTYHPINMPVCYKTLSILHILTAFSSAFSSYTNYLLPQHHYNHFHYGNRIPR